MKRLVVWWVAFLFALLGLTGCAATGDPVGSTPIDGFDGKGLLAVAAGGVAVFILARRWAKR